MKLTLTIFLAVSAALAAPLADAATKTNAVNAAYTAAIDTNSKSEPPPLWDPPAIRAPPLFAAPEEDLPLVPSWLTSVRQAPVQKVRVEKLPDFTGAQVQPHDNIYAPSKADEEANFNGEGSLRPAHKTPIECITEFVTAWFWWISVVVIAAIVVYIAEKMFVGSIKAARKARSASRAARHRAASLMQGTRSRAASLLGEGRRSRAGSMLEKDRVQFERSPSRLQRSRTLDGSLA